MPGLFSKLLNAGRASISFRRLGTALLLVGAGASIVVLARGTPWGAPWAAARSATASSSRGQGTTFERIDHALSRVLDESGIDRAAIRGRIVPMKTEQDSFARAELDLPIPQVLSFVQMNAGIARAAEEAGVAVLDVIELSGRPGATVGLEITLGMGERETHRLKLQREAIGPRTDSAKPEKPRIALVFDDLGFAMNGLSRELLELDVPVTFGVIANLKHSQAFAESARAHGHDVILHVPMEPYDKDQDPGRNAILHDLDEFENLRRLRTHLDGLPRYSGVSNHMGSRVTSDPVLMSLVLEEVRQRDRSLFFLDSRTTPFSVVGQEGRRAGVTVLVNNLFLDDPKSVDLDARAQISRLEDIARRRGSAIGIGHVSEETVQAAREAIDGWRKNGIVLVTLSELAGKERSGRRPTS